MLWLKHSKHSLLFPSSFELCLLGLAGTGYSKIILKIARLKLGWYLTYTAGSLEQTAPWYYSKEKLWMDCTSYSIPKALSLFVKWKQFVINNQPCEEFNCVKSMSTHHQSTQTRFGSGGSWTKWLEEGQHEKEMFSWWFFSSSGHKPMAREKHNRGTKGAFSLKPAQLFL